MGVYVMLGFAVVVAKYHLHEPILLVFVVPMDYVAENFGNPFGPIFPRNIPSVVGIGVYPNRIDWYTFAPLHHLNCFTLFADFPKFAGGIPTEMRILVDFYHHGYLSRDNPNQVRPPSLYPIARRIGCHGFVFGIGFVAECVDNHGSEGDFGPFGCVGFAASTDS